MVWRHYPCECFPATLEHIWDGESTRLNNGTYGPDWKIHFLNVKNSTKKLCVHLHFPCVHRKFRRKNDFLFDLCKQTKVRHIYTSTKYCKLTFFYEGKLYNNFVTKLMCKTHVLHHLCMNIFSNLLDMFCITYVLSK